MLITALMSPACAHAPESRSANESDGASSDAAIKAWNAEDARAGAALDAGQFLEAKKGFERALAMGREQLRQNPSSIRIKVRVATAYGRLGVAVARAGQLAEGKRLCEQGLALTDDVAAQTPHAEPGDFLDNAAYLAAEQLYVALGEMAHRQGQSEEAKRRWEQALAIDEAVQKLVPSAEFATKVRDLYVALAMLAADSKDYILAKQRFEQGIAIDEQLMAQHPATAAYQLHAANLHIGLGLLVNDPQHARDAQGILAAITPGTLPPAAQAQLRYMQDKAAQMLHE